MFWHEGRHGRVAFAITDRTGGVSEGPWGSLNLGTGGGDDADRVTRNLALVAGAVGADRLVPMTQVHGDGVAWTSDVADREIPVADALLTDRPGDAVLVRVADCTPVVLAATTSADEPLAAVVHAGRAGLVKGVVPAAVDALRARGAVDVHGWVGPRACGRCYEVPAELADAVAAVVPQSRSTTSWGTPALDVGAGVVAQLAAAGVAVSDLGAHTCTIEDDRWFSYRRQGHDSGRFGAIAVIR